ncbi:hypothetical protein AVEN_232198-1 [Araneus ventricosus]|uniref:Uncharacterized protein n=1 Tax=Araneus ventricosus TaxID=182803 RepID=A0A4Y2QTU0_ARAVE|nr:hypothetical protein AVEN_232198-1 [Araneus ventricosus]
MKWQTTLPKPQPTTPQCRKSQSLCLSAILNRESRIGPWEPGRRTGTRVKEAGQPTRSCQTFRSLHRVGLARSFNLLQSMAHFRLTSIG